MFRVETYTALASFGAIDHRRLQCRRLYAVPSGVRLLLRTA